VPVVISVSERPPWELTVSRAGADDVTTTGVDLFECLFEARRVLERKGLILCCEGARPEAWVSGMGSQMGGGRAAYRRSIDRSVTPPLVDIISPAPCEEVGTVEAQIAWNRSLPK
jgi:hypothetical protein